MVDEMTDDRQALLAYAREKAERLPPGAMFSIQMLFKDYPREWRSIPIGDRVSVGLKFYHAFFDKEGRSRDGTFKLRGKTDDGQQIYQKD